MEVVFWYVTIKSCGLKTFSDETKVAGKFLRELEFTRTEMMSQWLGQDMLEFMYRAFGFFTSIGGYQLPKISN